MVQESVAFVSRNGGIPSTLNCFLALGYVAANVYQFIILPLWLLPAQPAWGWTLLPLALLTNPFWSLIHEAIHDLFSPQPNANRYAGRLLAILFGAPFRILRLSHLLHHKLNRLPVEGAEYFDRNKLTKASAAPAYYFQILLGLYLVEVASSIYFLLPRDSLRRFKDRWLRPDSVSAILMQSWLGAEALREIRVDGMIVALWISLSFYLYGQCWPLLLAVLLARGFLISFFDNLYHYETPVSDIFYAKNLRLPQALARPLLHFNLHGIHHINPAISWINLPRAFDVQGGKFQANYFNAAWRQLRGPIAIQDLPQGAPTLRVRPG